MNPTGTLPDVADPAPPTLSVAGVPLCRQDLYTTIELLLGWLEEDGAPRRASVADLHTVSLAQADDALLDALQSADLVTADGSALQLLSRVLGHPLPDRIGGPELLPLIVGEACRHGHGVHFLGREDGITAQAVEVLTTLYPELDGSSWSAPSIDVSDPTTCRRAAETVRRSQADLVLVALGSPTQELFLQRYIDGLGCRLAIGLGKTFEVIIGRRSQAPVWLERLWLDELWNVCHEPARLLTRWRSDGRFLRGQIKQAVKLRFARTAV